jgi:type II secretory pathway component PulF
MFQWFPIRYDQIANFAGNLSTCLAAGVELRKAVRTSSGALVKSTPEFRRVWDRIEQGLPLSEALRAIGHRLPPFVVPVVVCGEQTGRLDQSLRFLEEHCRMLHRPREALRNAWLLPLAIFFGGKALSVTVLFLFGSWSSTVSAIGDLVVSLGSLAAVAIIIFVTPIKSLLDQIKLMIPVIASVERELAVNRFLHVFSMLYGSGGQRVEKMIRHACQTISNHWLRQDLLRAAVEIERGATLSEAFGKTKTLSRDEQSELAAGEHAGRLAETSVRVAERVGESAATKLTWITHVTLRITMGMVVMSVAGTILPILLWSLLGR